MEERKRENGKDIKRARKTVGIELLTREAKARGIEVKGRREERGGERRYKTKDEEVKEEKEEKVEGKY